MTDYMRTFTFCRRYWNIPLPFGFVLLIVFKFHGNIYGDNKVIRLDWRPGVWFCSLTYCWRCRETQVYMSFRRWWMWNSEHLAVRYGEYVESWNHPGYYVLNSRWLGHHNMV